MEDKLCSDSAVIQNNLLPALISLLSIDRLASEWVFKQLQDIGIVFTVVLY